MGLDRYLFEKTNPMGFILKITGVVVIIWGVMHGFIYLAQYAAEFNDISIIVLTTFFTPIVIGLLIIGFGEVIDLLQELTNKGKSKVEKKISPIPEVPFYAESEIKDYYMKMNTKVEEIKPTSKSDIFSVEVDGKIEYIELTGFTPRVLTEEEAEKLIN